MLEEAIPSIWAAVHSWFTPAVLFVLLNVVIGTIAVTSNAVRPHHKLARAPSAVLTRLRSFSLYRDVHLEPAPISETLEAVFHHPPPSDPADPPHPIERSSSDSGPHMPEMEVKIKKSASTNSTPPMIEVAKEEEEVDARADDFINRFRQQLKLQRLDSLLRYKEMIGGGAR